MVAPVSLKPREELESETADMPMCKGFVRIAAALLLALHAVDAQVRFLRRHAEHPLWFFLADKSSVMQSRVCTGGGSGSCSFTVDANGLLIRTCGSGSGSGGSNNGNPANCNAEL